jgi:ATP-dependent protease ClpP protease subunit
MPKVGTINIIGGIGGGFFGDVNLSTVISQVQSLGDVDEYLVVINSPGGEVFEGYAIRDYLLSLGKPITTRGIGLVASIATVVFLAGKKRELFSNTKFLIHNPWTFGEGDADSLEKKADELRKIESELLDLYVQETGCDRDRLQALMKEDKTIPSDEALELKFCTEIIEPVKAYATLINKQKPNTMSKISKIFKDAFKALKEHGVVLNESVSTTDGKTLEIEMAGDTIANGDTVTLEGQPASGTFELADGTTIVCEDGKVTSVTKPSASTDNPEDSAAQLAALTSQITELQNQVAQLSADNENLRNQNAQMTDEVTVITNHIKNLQPKNVVIPRPVKPVNRQVTDQEPTAEEIKAQIKEAREKRPNFKKRTAF